MKPPEIGSAKPIPRSLNLSAEDRKNQGLERAHPRRNQNVVELLWGELHSGLHEFRLVDTPAHLQDLLQAVIFVRISHTPSDGKLKS
jgi:hypothetical protein